MRLMIGPGKFEGCTFADGVAYTYGLESYDVLSDGNGGTSYTRVDGPFLPTELRPVVWPILDDQVLTDDEISFICGQMGCIVTELSDGFVSVEWFTNEEDFRAEWDALSREYDEDENDNLCPECSDELARDCQGELRCYNCDGPCPGCCDAEYREQSEY